MPYRNKFSHDGKRLLLGDRLNEPTFAQHFYIRSSFQNASSMTGRPTGWLNPAHIGASSTCVTHEQTKLHSLRVQNWHFNAISLSRKKQVTRVARGLQMPLGAKGGRSAESLADLKRQLADQTGISIAANPAFGCKTRFFGCQVE